MADFLHEIPEAKELFATIAGEMNVEEAMVEKDYWIMHCLWGLQQNKLRFEMKGGTSLSKGWGCIDRFSEDVDIWIEPRKGIPLDTNGESKAAIKERFDFYDELAKRISIPGIKSVRNPEYDDAKGRNGGIDLQYESLFNATPNLKRNVLLEVGFAYTAPNEPRDFSSWGYDRCVASGIAIIDNRAPGVKCFNPEYTFVEKLQTVCKRYRQHRDRKDPLRDQPRKFMRHYYDLFRLLELERVQNFIGTPDYKACKKDRIRGSDLKTFKSMDAFTIPDKDVFTLFEKEFESMETLLFRKGPRFGDVAERFREYVSRL